MQGLPAARPCAAALFHESLILTLTLVVCERLYVCWCNTCSSREKGKAAGRLSLREKTFAPREGCLQKGPGACPAYQGVLHRAGSDAGQGDRRGLCGEAEQKPLKKKSEIPTVPEEQEREFLESWMEI